MKKACLLFLLLAIFSFAYTQKLDNDSTNITISDYELIDGSSYNFRLAPNTNKFYKKVTWNSNDYKEGHMKKKSTNAFVMNYRYLTPQGYDTNYEPGYPMIVMFHGAVERGNCWQNGPTSYDCWTKYTGTSGVNHPRTSAPNAQVSATNRENFLNNDHQLLNGGGTHLNAWNRAGAKKPNDPTLNSRAFPGFVMFPQMYNGWSYVNSNSSPIGEFYNAVRIIRLFIKQKNVDPNRIYIHGLSNGGEGVLRALIAADWLFAAAAPMSAIGSGNPPSVTSHSFFYNSSNGGQSSLFPPDVTMIPLWFFQGGKDANPTVALTNNTVTFLRAKGANIRYTIYPDLGHGVWNTAYAEPDFFSWLLSKNKSDLHVEYNSPRVCATPGVTNPGARLFMPREMWAFQWEKDGQVIPGATSYIYDATTPGVYRGRFSRVQNPTEEQWNQWSKAVEITSSAPPTPALTNAKSLTLTDLNGSDVSELFAPSGYHKYTWHRAASANAAGTAYGSVSQITPEATYNMYNHQVLRPCVDGSCTFYAYRYSVRVHELDGCWTQSNYKTVWFSDQAPVNIGTPTGFTGELNNNTNALLRWNDVSNSERGYEIWRRKSTDAANQWTLVTITAEDVVLYLDQNLQQGVTYYYKLRGVSELGRSNYAPSNNPAGDSETDHVKIVTFQDLTPPTIPQNLSAEIIDTDIENETCSIKISWNASSDTYGVKEYQVNFAGTNIVVPAPLTSDTITGVPINDNMAFTVRAVDYNNNMSAPSGQVNVDTRIDGLFWMHSTSFYTDLTQIPPPKWLDREYGGRTDTLDIDLASQDSYILLKFYGYIWITTPGVYKFRMHHNDGVNIFLDGDSIIYYNNYVQVGCQVTGMNVNNQTSIFLDEGLHKLEVRYWQSEDDRCLGMEWQGLDAGPFQDQWYPFPNERYKSYDNFEPPSPPSLPTDLAANGTGMDEITLTWNYSGDPAEFEIYRSSSVNGPWTMIDRVAGSPYLDNELVPETIYYYRIRSVNDYGTSAYTAVVSGETLPDQVDPTAPTNLTLVSNTLSTASIAWTAATDNLAVAGYEIYVNGVLNTTTTQTYALVLGLTPQTTPQIYVVAFDAAMNRSEPSNVLDVPLTGAEVFYIKPSGTVTSTNFSVWGKNPDGSGTPPTDFNTNGSYFVINRTASVSSWTVNGSVSRIVLANGANVTVTGGIQGHIELQGSSILTLPNNVLPTFVAASPSSVVKYTSTTTQTIQPGTYGTLELRGTGTKVFPAGTTVINGNLVVEAGVAISGAASNGSTIILYGDLTFAGAPLFASSSSAVTMDLRKSGIQTLAFSQTLDLYHLIASPSTNVILNNLGSAATLNLGSSNGGGLTLPSGSSLLLQNNTLKITGAGSINGGGQTGKIYSIGGSIEITSSSNLHSNLHFDPPNKLLANLNVHMTGSGHVSVNNPVDISDGIKIKGGDLHSNGNIRMLSTPAKTANLHEIETNGRILGDVDVQRYFSAKNRMYRYLSSPVEGIQVGFWSNYFSITGDFAGATSTAPSIYTLDFKGDWVGYPDKDFLPPYNTLGAPLDKGRGYAVYIRNPVSFTVDYVGNPYQGPIPYAIYPPDNDFDGWNLIGNPYASTIRWSTNVAAWSKNADVSNIVAVRNNLSPTTGQFLYYDASSGLGTSNGSGNGTGGTLDQGKIAPGQAFYVMATGPNPLLAINEPAKFNNQQMFYRDRNASEISHLYINLRQGELTDQAIVMFTSSGNDDYDPNFDAAKLSNEGMFNFSTLTTNGKSAAINNMNNSFCNKRIRLNIDNAVEGEYTIEFPDVESLLGIGSIQLIDHYAGKTIDLGAGVEYVFNVGSDAASSGKERFEIVMNRPDLSSGITAIGSTECHEPGRIKLSSTQRGASYRITDKDGVELTTAQTSAGADLYFDLPVAALKEGVNQFSVRAGFEGCGSEVIIENASIEYYATPIVNVTDQSVCAGSSVIVNASVNSMAVVSYNWYDAENNKIKGFTGASMETSPINEETLYSVAAILQNGCEGPRQGFVVYPERMEEPELYLINDTLFATVNAEEYEWRLNGQVVETTPINFITGLTAGVYEVSCKNGGCVRTSRAFSVTGTDESSDIALQYRLYPNPTSSNEINLQVLSANREDVLVKVIDVLGKEHYINSFTAEELKSSVKITPKNDLRAGVYYVIMKQNATFREIKFVVKG